MRFSKAPPPTHFCSELGKLAWRKPSGMVSRASWSWSWNPTTTSPPSTFKLGPGFLTQPWPFQVLTTRGRSTENLALKITIFLFLLLITWRNNRVIFSGRSDKAEHNVGDIASFCELVDSVGALLDTVGGRRGTFERFLAAQHMLATAHASQPEHTSANVLGHPLHLMELCG